MHRSIPWFLAGGMFAGALALSGSAWATDARQAIKMCDNNPKCSYRVNDNGSVDLTVKTNEGSNSVQCPQVGPCHCDICDPPSRIKAQKHLDIGGILRRPPAAAQ